MSTYVSVVISPATRTSPVVISVSQATRPAGSSVRTASRTLSETWSATLSGCPSVTDSEVKRNSRTAIRLLRLLDRREAEQPKPVAVLLRIEQRVAQGLRVRAGLRGYDSAVLLGQVERERQAVHEVAVREPGHLRRHSRVGACPAVQGVVRERFS